MTATTKKLPVSISYGDVQAKCNEFLIPAMDAGFSGFRGVKSGRLYTYGALSFLGKEITINDVFARLVDSGHRIDDVDATLKMLDAYFAAVQGYRIGTVLTVQPSSDRGGFKLTRVAQRPNAGERRLP